MSNLQSYAGPERPVEYGVIVTCLNRVRRRLWVVRAAERMAVGLAWGAGVGIFMVGARLLVDRFYWISILAALIPLVAATTAWNEARHVRGRGRGGVVITPMFLWLMAGLTCVAVAATVTALSVTVSAHLPVWAFAAGTAALFVLCSALTVRPINAKTAAIFVDQQVGLKERVSTALEFVNAAPEEGTRGASEIEAAFRKPVIASALEACQSMRTAKVGYARADQRLYALAATVAIVATGVCFLTPLPAAANPANKPFLAVVDKGEKLNKILQEIEQKKETQNEEAQKHIQALKNAITDLRKGNMSPFEANERLTEEKGDLQRAQDEMDASEKVEKALDNIKGLDAIAQASDHLKDANISNSNGEAGSASAQDQAQKGVRDAAAGIGSKVKNGEMSQADKDKLASDLKKAAGAAKDDQQLKEDLSKAADAAKKGDGDQVASSLNAAGQRMGQQGAQSQLSGQALKDEMDAIDQANDDGHGSDEQRARAASGHGDQNNEGGSQTANSGQSGEQQSGEGLQGAGPQNGGQQGGGQEGGSQQGGSQQAGGGQQGSGQQNGNGVNGTAGEQMRGGGSTNLHAPSGPGDHSAGKPLGGSEAYVKVYDETQIQSQGKTEKVSGKINPLAPAAGTIQVKGQGDNTDSTIQTYESQLPAARKRAMDDLQTQQIPPQYRDLIRDYYTQ